jgi:membrane protease YdiL (CAAX protease family)
MEPLIMYLVLFLPSFASSSLPPGELYQFTVSRELERILGHNIPSLLLLWYISYVYGRKIFPKIRSGDFQSMVIALPGLLGIGLGISVLSSIIPGPDTAVMAVEAPGGIAAWVLIIISCFSTGYLEETYFRHYLLSRFWKRMDKPLSPDASFCGAGLGTHAGPVPGIVVSVALFSLCHIYEGPWGVTNAALAGLLLSFVYYHYGALHGLAWAHGLYNVFIYANGV